MKKIQLVVFLLVIWIIQIPARTPEWMSKARIIGICRWGDNVEARLQEALAANINVLDIHAEIPGEYQYFLNPAPRLEFIRQVSERAHQLGLKTVLYVAGLECLSKKGEHTFFTDHPDWVQRNIHGEPAVFDASYAFWIAPDEEDVWISPLAPAWRERYMQLMEMIATLPLDGIYMDIPYWMTHFEGWTDSWASFDDYTVAEFHRRTGLDARAEIRLGDFSDPGFRQWVLFRQKVIQEFLQEVNQRIKQVNPEMKFIVELYPGIEFDALTTCGDPYELIPLVDAVCHETNPYEVQTQRGVFESLEFYITLLALRAFDGDKPTWMLTYASKTGEDPYKREALKNLAGLIVMAGGNFWETGDIHMCSTTTDSILRGEIFDWIRRNEDLIYERRPYGRIGIYFSPWSRNVDAEHYLAEFLGTAMLLLQQGYPIEVITPRNLTLFGGEHLIVPAARIVSEQELLEMSKFAEKHHLVIVGDFAEMDSSFTPVRSETLLKRFASVIRIEGHPGRDYYIRGRQLLPQLKSAEEFRRSALQSMANDFVRACQLSHDEKVVDNPWVIPQLDDWNERAILSLFNVKGLEASGNQTPVLQRTITFKLPVAASAGEVYSFLDKEIQTLKINEKKNSVLNTLNRLGWIIPVK